jgi:hypothetical protein
MPTNSPPHPLLAAEIDLLFGDGHSLRRWSDRRCDHRTNRVANAGEIGLCHGRQAALQGDHIVAQQMSEGRVQYRPASSVEQRCSIPECVARHEELDPVHMRPFMQEFLSQRPEVGHSRGYFDLGIHRPGGVRPRAQ